MLDHVTIGVSNIERSKAFYDKALKAIGIERVYAEASPAPAQQRQPPRSPRHAAKPQKCRPLQLCASQAVYSLRPQLVYTKGSKSG
jgi:hypothetical protein